MINSLRWSNVTQTSKVTNKRELTIITQGQMGDLHHEDIAGLQKLRNGNNPLPLKREGVSKVLQLQLTLADLPRAQGDQFLVLTRNWLRSGDEYQAPIAGTGNRVQRLTAITSYAHLRSQPSQNRSAAIVRIGCSTTFRSHRCSVLTRGEDRHPCHVGGLEAGVTSR